MKNSPAAKPESPPTKPVAWSAGEKSAWEWPDQLPPSVWCEQNVIIPDNGMNPEPGPYSFDRTPWWREVADLVVDPEVRQIWCYKGNQLGYTQLLMLLACYFAAQKPGALAILMPNEDSVEELFAEQLKPIIESTPAVRRLKSKSKWDSTSREITLHTMPIYGLFAGSKTNLERRTLRYALGDEINLYRPFRDTASPIQLLLKRISNWQHLGKAVFGSKPTTRDGNITLGYESCPDKRRYFVPCRHCGKYQPLIWSQVKWPRPVPGKDKFERANWVKLNPGAAFYECENCRGELHDADKPAFNRAGKWANQNQTVEDGRLIGERIRSQNVGLWIHGLHSPWLSFSQLAAEFIEAEGDKERTRDFRNARLALPWDEVIKTVRPSIVRDKREQAGPPLIVPAWAVAVYATFDTQKDWFAGVIRAWGYGMRSALIWHGEVREENFRAVPGKSPNEAAWDEVFRLGLESRFEVEGGGILCPKVLLIDSGGDRTDEVYQFAARDPRILPTKGMSAPGRKLWYDSEPRPGVSLRMVDTGHFKGALYNLMHDPDPLKWMPHREVSEQYCMEMASETLIVDPKTQRRIWKENGTARNEAWDLETLQRGAAEMENMGMAAPVEQVEEPAEKRMQVSDWLKQ